MKVKIWNGKCWWFDQTAHLRWRHFFFSSLFQRPEEHLLKNQEFDREGYLFLIERSTKVHCERSVQISSLFLSSSDQIKLSAPQRSPNITVNIEKTSVSFAWSISRRPVRNRYADDRWPMLVPPTLSLQLTPYDLFVRHCLVHPADEKVDKRFMFDLHGIEKGGPSDKMVGFTFQAMNEDEFEGWVSITGGQINISKPQLSSKTEMQSKEVDSACTAKTCVNFLQMNWMIRVLILWRSLFKWLKVEV